MTHDLDAAQRHWINQVEEEGIDMSVAELRASAVAFQSRIARRNRREYVAAALAAGAFIAVLPLLPGLVTKAGAVLAALGVVLLAWNLHRRARAASHEEAEHVAKSWAAFHREQLVRQRDALRSVWLWYLGPLVPGMAVLLLGVVLTGAGTASPLLAYGVPAAVAACVAGIFLYVGRLNRRAADALQTEIEALDELR